MVHPVLAQEPKSASEKVQRARPDTAPALMADGPERRLQPALDEVKQEVRSTVEAMDRSAGFSRLWTSNVQ